MKVTALLVSHDGARWLPAVLDGLGGSTRRPDHLVAVDTGSQDDSVALVRAATGTDPLALPRTTTYAAAVRAGLASCPPAEPDEWVWLLHDDANPEPTCLEELAAAAAEAGEEYAAIGPKLREWPSLRRLLEVGVTVTGTGRRETGLEPGEYDQGQHDVIHPALAVNTAGLLVRREVLEQVGLDDRLPVLGADLDLGWRAALAGHATVVVPSAVLHHVEASRRGLRTSELVRHPRREERIAMLRLLLVNGPAALVPWRLVRLLVGGLLRVLGFLLVRAGAEARDEVLALAAVYGHPLRLVAMRRDRRGAVTVPRKEVRPLLAPWWLPYRRGVDVVGDLVSVLLELAGEALSRRDARGRSPVQRLLLSPVPWVALGLAVLSLVADRDLLSGAPLHGGALLSPPSGVDHWWSLWAREWHWLGTGSSAPAPAYVLPLALAGTLLLGATASLLWLLLVMAVPLAMLSAHRFTRRVMPGTWAPVWAAVAYALVPVTSGAVGEGRLGTTVAAVLLPFVATSALGLRDASPERQVRAAWRTALGLGVLACFAPTAWLLALALAPLAGRLTGARVGPRLLLPVLGLPLLMVLPWLVGAASTPGALLLEAGRAGGVPVDPTATELLLGRGGGPGAAPLWLGIGLPLAALVALVRPDTRARVARAWLVAAVAAVLLAVLAFVRVDLPGVSATVRPWAGFLLLAVQASFVVAAGLAAAGAVSVATAASFGWRQVVGAVAVVGALASPGLGAAWWVSEGLPGPLDRDTPATLPTYMSDLGAETDTGAVLVVRGGKAADVRYRVLRDGTLRTGDDGVLALTPEDTDLTSDLGELLAGTDADVGSRLAAHGIGYVYAPPPVSTAVSGAFDAAQGFAGASAPVGDSRAWRIEADQSLTAVTERDDLGHRLALGLQVLAWVAGVVLALPGRRRRR